MLPNLLQISLKLDQWILFLFLLMQYLKIFPRSYVNRNFIIFFFFGVKRIANQKKILQIFRGKIFWFYWEMLATRIMHEKMLKNALFDWMKYWIFIFFSNCKIKCMTRETLLYQMCSSCMAEILYLHKLHYWAVVKPSDSFLFFNSRYFSFLIDYTVWKVNPH